MVYSIPSVSPRSILGQLLPAPGRTRPMTALAFLFPCSGSFRVPLVSAAEAHSSPTRENASICAAKAVASPGPCRAANLTKVPRGRRVEMCLSLPASRSVRLLGDLGHTHWPWSTQAATWSLSSFLCRRMCSPSSRGSTPQLLVPWPTAPVRFPPAGLVPQTSGSTRGSPDAPLPGGPPS